MSGKSTLEEKNIVIGIQNSLKKNTKYMYYDGMEFKASQDVKEVRAESLEFKVAQGTYFDIGDYFILKEVHNLGITNVPTLLKRMAIEKRREPDKAYPEYDYQTLLSRMRFLVRSGLLYSFEFLDTYKRSMFIYCCTMYGWRLYKHKLQSSDVYDKNMVFRPETEVFQRLASNSVAYSFAYSPFCTSVLVNYSMPYGYNKRGYIYAKASIGEGEEETVYIIEPIYFSIDHRKISDEENERNILERLGQMEEIIKYLNDSKHTKLILCVENYDGLTKLLKLMKTRDIEFYCNNCYFTSENVLFDSNGVLSRSFLRLSATEDKFKFSLAKDAWF